MRKGRWMGKIIGDYKHVSCHESHVYVCADVHVSVYVNCKILMYAVRTGCCALSVR